MIKFFEKTLVEDCFWKDTLHYVRKDTFQNMVNKTFSTNSQILNLKWPEYLHLFKRNPYIYLALKLVHGKGVKNNDRQTEGTE